MMSGGGTGDFVKVKSQCGGDRSDDGRARVGILKKKGRRRDSIKNRFKKFSKEKDKSNFRVSDFSKKQSEKLECERVEKAVAKVANDFVENLSVDDNSSVDSSVKALSKQATDKSKENFELMARLNKDGIEGYMLLDRG